MQQIEQKGFQIPLDAEERKNMLNTLAKFDVTKQMEKLKDKPLFFWHGEKDPVVPFAPTAGFIQTFEEEYRNQSIEFIKEKSAGHAVSRKGMLAATKWLANSLA
jgi:predicted esterase